MARLSDPDRLVASCHDAAFHPEGWPEVRAPLARALGAETALTGLVPATRMWEGGH